MVGSHSLKGDRWQLRGSSTRGTWNVSHDVHCCVWFICAAHICTRYCHLVQTPGLILAGRRTICHWPWRSTALNLPSDMQGLDLEAVSERIRHKCGHVCRHQQTKLISGTGKELTGPPWFLGPPRTSSNPWWSQVNSMFKGNLVVKLKHIHGI